MVEFNVWHQMLNHRTEFLAANLQKEMNSQSFVEVCRHGLQHCYGYCGAKYFSHWLNNSPISVIAQVIQSI